MREPPSVSDEATTVIEGDTTAPCPGAPAWWREALVILALGGLVLLFVCGMQSGQNSAAAGALTPETPAPEVILELAGGGEVTLSAQLGKPVVLVFWATWCGACREEMPELDRLTREADGRYAVLTASRESPEALARFAAARHLMVTMGSDRSGQAFAAYRVESLPTTVIINAEGRVVHDFVGGASYEALRDHMDRQAPR